MFLLVFLSSVCIDLKVNKQTSLAYELSMLSIILMAIVSVSWYLALLLFRNIELMSSFILIFIILMTTKENKLTNKNSREISVKYQTKSSLSIFEKDVTLLQTHFSLFSFSPLSAPPLSLSHTQRERQKQSLCGFSGTEIKHRI